MKDLSFLRHEIPGLQIARYLIENLPIRKSECHPLFVQRLLRKKKLPNLIDTSYISDLGLRRIEEPSHFFIENAITFFKSSPHEIRSVVKNQDCITNELFTFLGVGTYDQSFDFSRFVKKHIQQPLLLHRIMMYYVDVLGSWSDADQIADQVVQHMNQLPQTEQTASLLTTCGNLFAQRRDIRCRELYRRSIDLWEDVYHWFMTYFRLAVAEIKRLDSNTTMIESSLKCVKEASNEYGKKTNNPINTLFLNGLIANLEALHFLKNGDLSTAGVLIHEAWHNVSNVSIDRLDVEESIVGRYSMQIIENLALYYGLTKDWSQSVDIFQKAVELSKQIHRGSLAEALSKYGYVLLQTGKSEDAIQVLLEAEQINDNSTSIDKLREVRKMLAVAYYKRGQYEKSAYWVEMSRQKMWMRGVS